MRRLVALAATLIAASSPAAAVAETEHVEGFDGFPAGTTLTTQVAGVEFAGSPQAFTPVHTTTFSPPRALRMPAHCDSYQCPNGAYRMTINFTQAARRVRVRIGDDDETCFEFCAEARMIAFSGPNATGTRVADSLANGPRPGVAPAGQYGPITTQVTVTAADFQIRSVRVYMGKEDDQPGAVMSTPTRVQLDDLRFVVPDTPSEPPPPPPATPAAPTIAISEPATGLATDRNNLFVRGTVAAPGGLVARCVSVDAADHIPDVCHGSDRPGEFAEYVSGLAVGAHTLTVWALDAYGQVSHTNVEITILANLGVDIGIDLMEPIQSIQSYALPELQPALRRTPGIPYEHRQATYRGLALMQAKATYVRLHAVREAAGRDATFLPPASLYGFSVGAGGALVPLPGSPVRPMASPTALADATHAGALASLARRRATSEDAYQFQLPLGWTRGTVLLVGEVNRPGLPGSRSECDSCMQDNAYAMQVAFHPGGSVEVWPYWLNYPGVRLPGTFGPFYHPPYAAFARLAQVAPFTINVHPYTALIDVSDLAARPDAGSDDVMRLVMDRVQNTKDAIGTPAHTIGLHDGRFRGLSRTYDAAGFLDIVPENAAEAGVDRPLTSVAHELTHQLGSPHAGTRCPDDGSPGSWPPDEMGFIGGWGIDLNRVRGVGSTVPGGLLGVFGRAATDQFDPVTPHNDFDYMSYCVTDTSTRETDSWISVRRWAGQFISVGGGGGFRRSRAGAATSALGPITDVIKVKLSGDQDGSLSVEQTVRGLSRIVTPDNPGNLRAVLRDAAGHILGSGAAIGLRDHIDQSLTGQALRGIIAFLPVGSGTPAVVQIERNGAVVAEAKASTHAPAIKLLAPAPGAGSRPVRGSLDVRWQATDADSDPLSARIDLSTDGGKTWRPVATGITGERLRVPASLLRRTRDGRIRVVVQDGFLQAEARSGRLRIDGVGPQVVITSPADNTGLAADAPLNLVGQAFDDAGKEIRGRKLRWTSGRRPLGRGAAITVPAYRVGRTVTLTATDRFGRRGKASVRVRVRGVAPIFTRFDVPAKLAPTARRFTVTLASTLPGRVTITGAGVAGTRAEIGPTAKAVAIRVRSAKPLKLRFALRARGRSVTARATVARG